MAIITIPIEIKSREFDGKLWLAANLAIAGHSVAVGDNKQIYRELERELRPDVHIAKDHIWHPTHISRMESLRKTGARIAALETEGGVFRSDEHFLKLRCSDDTLEHIDIIFAWGSKQAKIITEGTAYPADNVIVTGNPRFDLLHPKLRRIYRQSSNKLKNEFGDYILYNTNFTSANHYDDNLREDINKSLDISSDEEQERYQMELLRRFIESITTISDSIPECHIIIRPHPSESHDFYREQFSDNSSVSMRHEGDVREWIYGAECVIHNGCTTGIESAMLNTPVLAYDPDIDAASADRPHLPNAVSISVSTLDELVERVRFTCNRGEQYQMLPEQEAELQRYFANVSEPAAPKVVEGIKNIDGLESDKSYPRLSRERRLKQWVKKQPVAPYVQRLRGVERGRSGYWKQKFPGLSLDEVRSRLCDIEAQVGDMGLQASRVNYLDDVYWIEQKQL